MVEYFDIKQDYFQHVKVDFVLGYVSVNCWN